MATAYKRLGALTSAGVIATADTLYNCTALSAVVSTIAVCNRAATSATYRVGVSTTNAFEDSGYIVYDATVPANDTIFLTLGVTVDATNDFLLCSASAATVSFSAFGSENS